MVGVVMSSEDGEENKDMFSADFQVPSAGPANRKRLESEDQPPLEESTALVAASSGAMPETFRDESQSS